MFNLPSSKLRASALLVLGLLFIAAGTNHFLNPDFYVRIMPPWLPAHRELVALSGVLEILGGLAVFLAPVRSWAGWGLVLLLVAVFPANLHMALNPELFPELPAAALWARLPLQGVLIAWAWWATRPEPASPIS
jgi:uncharacterized membrane protein